MKENLFSLREEETFEALQDLKDCAFVVIGGYAVNAYTLPRFSVDCDIIIRDKGELRKIERLLMDRNYIQRKLSYNIRDSGWFLRYEKKLENNFIVSMDILIDHVKDRMTDVDFSAGWIFENSGKKSLKGKTITKEIQLRIINIDALLVMKMIACRSTDIRDVFMMMPYAKDKEWIKKEVAKRYDPRERIQRIIDKITSKQFKDGLSGVYGYFDAKVFEKHRKAITMFLHD
ncbi:MAG TPA: nucleotidyl transferase AbiEii/AbiGii toxin family protein [Candidatus Nanoarchaeia archaeon]|nr:nucleotidyl transferase AbiEii/AbiGii toxin family protein [Candidatus Nanoarchaeia archaeon]